MVYLASAAQDRAFADRGGYPFSLPAVQALANIEFAQVTLLVGDNGTGKSTLVEALAVAAGFNAEGGSRNLRFETYATHSELASALRLRWMKRPRWGWFLRAETFYGMATHIQRDDDPASGVAVLFPDLHHRSHGESFLTLIDSRMSNDGLYLLDEPESALSFHGQLKLLATMHHACANGAQYIIATHSPLLMSYPGAVIYEFDDTGAHKVDYDDVTTVSLWRTFLESPDRYFRHLFED
jgi:predicted ATPase